MSLCHSCGAENIEGARMCLKCGATLAPVPPPESWRHSGDLGQRQRTQSPGYQQPGDYAPPPTPQPPAPYPNYTPPQTPHYPSPPVASQPMHPAVPAIVSLFFPGLGLLFVPGKAPLGFLIFGGNIALSVVLILVYLGFTAITLGFGAITGCCFLFLPIINVVAALHSWDSAAKASNGQFQPIIFK